MHRGGDRSGDPSGPAPGSRSGGDGRFYFARGPSCWSDGGGGSPPHRFSSHGRGGGGGMGGGDGGGGGRFHPYCGSSDYSSGRGGGYRGGGGSDDFGEPAGGPRHRYDSGAGGRGDYSDHDNRSNYVKLFIGPVPRTATEDDVPGSVIGRWIRLFVPEDATAAAAL